MSRLLENNRIPLSMLKLSFLSKLPFKGSSLGMRYIIKKETVDDKNVLKVYTYKDLYNFENTNKEDIKEKTFDFSNEGIQDVISYLDEINDEYIDK